jgi:hypothetical protein
MALFVAMLVDYARSQPRTRLLQAGIVAVVAPLVAWQMAVYASAVSSPQRRAEVHSLLAHLQPCEAAAPAIGSWLAARTGTGEPVYNLGRDSAIYYYAGRQPAAAFMYDRPFYLDPSTPATAAADLRSSAARYIADTTADCSEGQPPPPEIAALLAERYEPVATVETATIYQLRD